MSLSHLLAGIWFILIGCVWALEVSISLKFLGVLALVTGIVYIVEQFHPIVINRPNGA